MTKNEAINKVKQNTFDNIVSLFNSESPDFIKDIMLSSVLTTAIASIGLIQASNTIVPEGGEIIEVNCDR